MTDKEVKKYLEFMTNRSNIKNCPDCPENLHERGYMLPCGQQKCWVKLHVEKMEGTDERQT